MLAEIPPIETLISLEEFDSWLRGKKAGFCVSRHLRPFFRSAYFDSLCSGGGAGTLNHEGLERPERSISILPAGISAPCDDHVGVNSLSPLPCYFGKDRGGGSKKESDKGWFRTETPFITLGMTGPPVASAHFVLGSAPGIAVPTCTLRE